MILTLDDSLQWQTVYFVNAAREVGFPLVITSARRSIAEQQRLLLAGRTKTLNSKHLDGRAFDVDMWGWNRDDVPSWAWDYLGPLGESYGFTWGGRWSSFRDVGHFEV